MKKSFRRALACLLAVLMVAFSMPFTALAEGTGKGWWGDNNYDATTNEKIPHGEQSYEGWNSESYDLGLSWADAISINDDLEMGTEARAMMDEYKPVLTVTVSDQGDADNRIYREYYGYSQSYDYDTVKAAGHIMNPADLKAGDRIAVTFEIGGFDMLYSGQLKGMIDTDYLAFAYYKLNPQKKDQWAKCSPTQTTQAFITRGYSYYGDATTDAGAQVTDNERGQFYTPFTSNTAVPSSAYVGADARTFGKNGMIICTLSMEVLQDCDLKDVLDLTTDKDNNPAYGTTYFQPYDADQTGGDKAQRFSFDTEDTTWTYGLIALDYSEYKAAEEPGPVKHEHNYTQEKTPATCTEPGKITYKCSNEDGQCDRPEYTETDARTPLGHDYTSPECVVTPNNDGAKHTVKCLRYDQCGTTQEVECTPVPDTDKNKEASSCRPDGGGWEGATKCEVCGQVLNAGQATAPKAHTPTDDTEKNKPATCTDAGWENATKCEVCGETINEGQEIPALNHEYSGDVIMGTDGEHHQVKCTRYDQCGSTKEVACTWNQTDAGSEPTYDTPGKQPTYTCQECGQTKGGETIPALQGVSVTVKSSDLGTSTVQGQDVTDADVTVKVAPNSEVKLKATPKDGAEFVAWTVNGKVVSTEAEHTFTALTNITFEPVFREVQEETFTVVFADMYGNIYNTQTVSSGTDVVTPDGPVIAGYTFTGWSLTDEQIDALTEATTIIPKYERDTEQTFTVTATGATITTPYATTQDTNTGIGYNTKVTVTAEGAKVWKIDGVTVAYGETYEFYIGSDVVLTFETGAVTETPVVAAISVTEIGAPGALKASFLASRQMTKDATYIRAGFIYGLDPSDENLTLGDVDETSVRAYYCSTNAEQFALNVGRKEQTGKIVARAFLAYSKDGATQVVYAEPQSYTYD